MSMLSRMITLPGSGYARDAMANQADLAESQRGLYDRITPGLESYGQRLMSGTDPSRQARLNATLAGGQRQMRAGLGQARMTAGAQGMGGSSFEQSLLAQVMQNYGRTNAQARMQALEEEEAQRMRGASLLAGLANPALLSSLYGAVGQQGNAMANQYASLIAQIMEAGMQAAGAAAGAVGGAPGGGAPGSFGPGFSG